MNKNLTISLGSYFENFVNYEILSGRYDSVDEVIRTALRLLETKEHKIKELKKAIELGEKSNLIDSFNPEKNLQDLHNKYL